MAPVLIPPPEARQTVVLIEFDSRSSVSGFLGLADDCRSCLAYAPGAKAKHCGRRLPKERGTEVSNLLSQLLDAQMPSQLAHRLLETLSSKVICSGLRHPRLPDGTTAESQAEYIYGRWREKLWWEYLALNGLSRTEHDGALFDVPPALMSSEHWAANLPSRPTTPLSIKAKDDPRGQGRRSFLHMTPPRGNRNPISALPLSGRAPLVRKDAVLPVPKWKHEPSESEDSDGDAAGHEYPTSPLDAQSPLGSESSPFESPWSRMSTRSGFSLADTGLESADTTLSNLDMSPAAGSPRQKPKRVTLTGKQDVSVSDITAKIELLLLERSLPSKAAPSSASHQEASLTFSSSIPVSVNKERVLGCSKEVDATEQSSSSTVTQNSPRAVRRSPRNLKFKSLVSPGLQSEPLNSLLKKMEETCGYDTRRPGYVYYFPVRNRNRNSRGRSYMKIGHVRLKEDNGVFPQAPRNASTKPLEIQQRLRHYKRECQLDVDDIIAYEAVPCAAWRVEALIHQYLGGFRREEHCCCGKLHKELFEVSLETARQAVQTWRAFGECMPYDEDGKIKQFWAAKAKQCRVPENFGKYSVETLVGELSAICEEAKEFETTGRCESVEARPARKFGKTQTW